MNLSDQELELLDRYLDGDLAEAEIVGLEARLKSDREMSRELASLREFRSLRSEAFASLEPGEAEAQQLQWYVRGALNQQQQVSTRPVWGGAAGWTRGLTRAAAVLLIGFAVGYFYRGGGATVVKTQSAGSPSIVTSGAPSIDLSQNGPPLFIPEGRNVAGYGAGSILTVGNGAQPTAFEVTLTDSAGNVVSMQRFASLQEARQFVDEMNRLHLKQRQLQSNGVRLIGDGF